MIVYALKALTSSDYTSGEVFWLFGSQFIAHFIISASYLRFYLKEENYDSYATAILYLYIDHLFLMTIGIRVSLNSRYCDFLL